MLSRKVTTRVIVAGVIVASVTAGGAAVASAAEPAEFESVTVLQIPGLAIGPPGGGAALYNPTVHHGHGAIFPAPVGYGYTYTWTNLSTGASGTITDQDPDRSAIRTGAGQLVVTGSYNYPGTASIGTFYVSG
ncbi:hypothetical protein [Rhodococcus sp. NPDC127528]|uniref:hypothetical protein n=1 Tax=unclassified Rhodococcus (in: high G+C Gram-positive bacteria) TaxID=192944 RepID=UPI00363BB46F